MKQGPDHAKRGDVVLWAGRGLFRVKRAWDGGGKGRCYSLKGLEGQPDVAEVEWWRCPRVKRPAVELVLVVKPRRPPALPGV